MGRLSFVYALLGWAVSATCKSLHAKDSIHNCKFHVFTGCACFARRATSLNQVQQTSGIEKKLCMQYWLISK